MSRYHHYTTLKSPFTLKESMENKTEVDDVISTIAYYSLQDQGFIPSSLDDMNEDIYSLLCGEAKDHIMKHEPSLYAMMNEWDSRRREYWEESRVIQHEQNKQYSISYSHDKAKNSNENITTPTVAVGATSKYIFRTDTNRVVLNLSESDSYSEVVKFVGNKFVLSSPGEDVITVLDINSSLQELSITPGKLYFVE